MRGRKGTVPVGYFSILLALAPAAAAEDLAAQKRQFTLFNPAPRHLMRELSTDRPDLTESPFTVDAGHFQVEMDVVSYTHDRRRVDGEKIRFESLAIAPVTLKAGLLHNLDFQLEIGTYRHDREKFRGEAERSRGFGDVTARMKVNLWGNDSGPTALGLLPLVKFPTNQGGLGNNAVEAGVLVPFAMDLPGGWDLGLMTGVEFRRDAERRRYHPEFVNSVAVGREIAGNLGGYAEFFSTVSTERGSEWIGIIGIGLVYGLTEDIQLDGGINFGATRGAEDYNPFIGLSWRF